MSGAPDIICEKRGAAGLVILNRPQALNALNLANQSDTSQGARVLVGPQPPVLPGRTCPAGMTGSGTSADPCRPSQCSTTPSGTPADPACIVRRYTDSHGNVLTYLELASRRVPDTPVAATRQPNTGVIDQPPLSGPVGMLVH